jgi:hypothetical protein
MFCPSCKCEFRSGFTHCEACDLDLVENLTDTPDAPGQQEAEKISEARVRLADYCGFFSMDEARQARDQLRGAEIRTEIVIRERPDAQLTEPIEEEFWLRVDAAQYQKINALLEQPAGDKGSDEELTCEDCGETVLADSLACPGCGARFDDE